MFESSTIPHVLRRRLNGRTRYIRQGTGTPAILIHGVGMNAEIWAPQISALARNYDVIAYDLLGHGGSSLPPVDASLSDCSDQLKSLIDGLNLRSAHLIGHSMGALVALDFTLAYPGYLSSVVALNAVYCRTPEQRQSILRRAAALETGDQEWQEETIARWFGVSPPKQLVDQAEIVRQSLRAIDPHGYARAYQVFAISDETHKHRLETLTLPTLFMTGELDINSTAQMSQAMAKAAPQGRCEIITGARHMMALTHPIETNKRLLDFLGTRQGAAAPSALVETNSFRQALGSFVTGITIVSTIQANGEPRGFTANSFTSVSLDPPLVLVCIGKAASSFPIFSETKHFAINVLAEHQKETSSLFASKSTEKFSRTNWFAGPAGSPIIRGSAAWFDCFRHQIVDAGDHIILIGKVVGFGNSAANPLGYCRGAYLNFSLSQNVVAATSQPTRVGAILERDGAVLLVEGPNGGLDLPTGVRLDPRSDPTSLRGMLELAGATARLNFLFAVFEDTSETSPSISIYYRGTVDGDPAANGSMRFIRFEEIAWESLPNDAIRTMLKRYVRERSEDTFGVYVGDASRGKVKSLSLTDAVGLEQKEILRK